MAPSNLAPASTASGLESTKDYERVAAAIEYIRGRVDVQPTLEDIAAAVGLSEFHLQRLFSRWAGISPKRFLQVLTLRHAQERLAKSQDLLTTSLEVGLSGPGRLHDLFVTVEGMTPGEFKQGAQGLRVEYGIHPTPFGECLLAITSRGICHLEFGSGGYWDAQVASLLRRWPAAECVLNPNSTRRTLELLFAPTSSPKTSLPLLVKGTNFQIAVWRALLRIPPAHRVSYSQVAQWIGHPKATRAVGTAIGDNPIAFLIPCHRVIRSGGQSGGYRWGVCRKIALWAWEERLWENPEEDASKDP